MAAAEHPPMAALPLLHSSHKRLPGFPLSAWLHRWIQNRAHRLMLRESVSRFQSNQQPWQTGQLQFLGADSVQWDLLQCFCTNGRFISK